MIPGDRIGVLNALTLLCGLDPLYRVTLGLNSNTASILEDHHDDKGVNNQDRSDHPLGVALQPCPIWREVLCEVAFVNCVENTSWQKRPLFPLVAMIPNRLVQRIFFRRAIRFKLWRWRWRAMHHRRRSSKSRHRSCNASRSE